VGIENFDGEDDGAIGADGFGDVADGGEAAQFEIIADALRAGAKPAAAGDAKFCEETPAGKGDVSHHAG